MIKYLSQDDLRWSFSELTKARTLLGQRRTKKGKRIGAVAQDRALSALELGLGIKQRGYNIFVVGPRGTGRTSTVETLLYERAQKETAPDDIVLLYNFEDRDRPQSLFLPPSQGVKLKKSFEQLIERVLYHLEKAFEADSYIMAKQVLLDECRDKTDSALKEIEKEAEKNSFVLSHTGIAITLTPAGAEGNALSEEEFDNLSDREKHRLEQTAEKLEGKLEESMRKVKNAEKESEEALEGLQRETASQAIAVIFENTRSQWRAQKRIVSHLSAMEEDMLNRVRRFIHDDKSPAPESPEANPPYASKNRLKDEEEDYDYDEQLFVRYKVNVLVTRSKTAGAPVVFETHPTSSNIIGRIEQRMRGGETITDFTRIRPGALYKANGGYLILEAQELLRDASAWEGLKRAIKNREIELDDPGEPGRMVSIASLRPEPLPLNLKVILIGAPEIYYALAKNDPDFHSLFKVKADFDLEIQRSDENIGRYITFLSDLSREEELLKLSPEGVGRILEQAVRLSGNKQKITCRLGELGDLLREANYWAKKEKKKTIDPSDVRMALFARSEREGFVQQQILEEITAGKIIFNLKDKIIGQTNGLTVVEVGNYDFGIPLRITCQTGCGKGEIVDIEREAEQSGMFHSKGRLIIKGFMSNLFGRVIPFAFQATLCMEQTYSEIDGDSASMAEACTLLSALADVPIDQRFAMTGAIDQMGNVQAVGGINEKIEGFFQVCRAVKSPEVHAVIIPTHNVDEIMLDEDVIEATKTGKFKIIAVNTVAETMEIITGLPFDGGQHSIKARTLQTLRHFNLLRSNFEKGLVDTKPIRQQTAAVSFP